MNLIVCHKSRDSSTGQGPTISRAGEPPNAQSRAMQAGLEVVNGQIERSCALGIVLIRKRRHISELRREDLEKTAELSSSDQFTFNPYSAVGEIPDMDFIKLGPLAAVDAVASMHNRLITQRCR